MSGIGGIEKGIEKFIGLAILIGIGLILLVKFAETIATSSPLANATIAKIITAIAQVGDWASTIVVILVAVAVYTLWKKSNMGG